MQWTIQKQPQFTNLLHQKCYFDISVEWHSFDTSHGKNASDGIGGIIKHLAAFASLQRATKGQILTPRDLYL